MPNLSKLLGGPDILIKRDDLITLAFGGTKTRGLEYVFADAVANEADTIITVDYLEGNLSTLVTAAARRLGMEVVLILRDPTGYYPPHIYESNLLLKRIMGAQIETVVTANESVESGRALALQKAEKIAEQLKERGRKPYIALPENPLWAAGVANAIPELVSQAEDFDIDYLVHASSFGSTQAGLVLGTKVFESKLRVIGISNGFGPKAVIGLRIAEIVNRTALFLGLNVSASGDDITIVDDDVGKGFNIIDEYAVQTMKRVAEAEGIFLDPVYTARGMLGLINLIRKGYFKGDVKVVFLHTGGMPILFSYREPISDMLESRKPSWVKPPWIL